MRPPEVIAERQRQMRARAASGRRGRPQLPLDPIEVFELAHLGLSNRQIAVQLGCNHKTLRRFAADLERARLRRRALLQLGQMQLIAEEDSWRALEKQLKSWRAAGKRDPKPLLFTGEK